MSWRSITRLVTWRSVRAGCHKRCPVMLVWPFLFWLVLSNAVPTGALAQGTFVDQEDVPAEECVLQLWDLKLTRAAEPQPALKYELRPPYRTLKPGDATTHYYRAMLMDAELPGELKKQYADRIEHWHGEDDASRDEMREWLARFRQIYDELYVATYCEQLDWDLRIRDLEGLATIEFVLPDAQRMRDLGRMLQVKVRLEITEGRLDDAIETLRVGYRLAHAAAKTPTLINDLVGIAIGSMMTFELTRLVAHPDAPNMYWAIASLPRPVIDMREAMDWERSVPWRIFPYLRDPEKAVRSPDQWRQLVMETYTSLHQLSGDYSGKPGPLSELAATGLIMKGYPLAKQALVEKGMSRETVDAMPVGQVIAIHTSQSLEYAYDETFKWTFLSFGDVYDRAISTERRLRDQGHIGNKGGLQGVLPVANVLIPGISQAWFASARLERQLVAVQTIEAIRLYAASHSGQLPESLDEITSVVIPLDPLSRKPLEYRANDSLDGSAVLETAPRGEGWRSVDVFRYQLRINK